MTGRPYMLRLVGFGLRAPKARVRGMDVAGVVEAVGPSVTRFRPGEGWDEALVLVPGAAITRPRTRLEMTGRYAAYRYWFYQ